MRREDIANLLDVASIDSCSYVEGVETPLKQLVKQATREALEHTKIREAIQTDRLTAAK